jgi:hypothetical protein
MRAHRFRSLPKPILVPLRSLLALPLRSCLWLAACASSAPALDALGWEQYLSCLREGHAQSTALYFGAADNRLPRQWLAGGVTGAGACVSVVMIPGHGQLESPLGGPQISAAQLQRFFGVTAGTVLFLDRQGMPLPQLSLPQALHQDDLQLLGLYLAYVAGGHDRAMTIAEYAQALGAEAILSRAIARERQGCARVLAPGQALARATTAGTHAVVDPWAEGGVFYLYAHDLGGRVFRAQLHEIMRAFAVLHPRLTVITPTGEDPDAQLIDDSCECVLAHAEGSLLRAQGPSPLLVVSARTAQGMQALRLDGFQPAPVLAHLLGLRLVDDAALDHDIPYGEVDVEQSSTTTSTGSAVTVGATPELATSAREPVRDDTRREAP